MTTELTVTTTNAVAWTVAEREDMIAKTANEYAANATFADYHRRKSVRTRKIQRDNLVTFAAFLGDTGIVRHADDLQHNPASWSMMTDGLVVAYREWMLQSGYSIGTINLKLSTIKVYCKLATKAGALDVLKHKMIRLVDGYGKTESERVDEERTKTRMSAKKAAPTHLDVALARQLKNHPDTSQGRRDAVLMAILIDHGLRAGEVAILKVGDFDIEAGTFAFYRPKVNKVQTHRMTADTAAAVRAYIEAGDAPAADEKLIRGSRKGGQLGKPGISASSLSMRVRALGKRAGIDKLSAHDCRHYWATDAARNGTDAFALRDAGGWSSLAMPSRYVEGAAIANEGLKQSA